MRIPVRRGRLAAVSLLLLGAVLTGCGAAPAATGQTGAPSEEKPLTEVRVAVLTGSQYFPMKVMLDQGFAEKHGLRLEVKPVANPAAITTALDTHAVDLAFHSFDETVNARAAGKDWRAILPISGFDSDDVIVPADSPIRSWADLKGRKIGSFGGPQSGVTTLLRMELKRFYGFDPVADGNLQPVAAPLLTAMLQQGQVDAALLVDPFVSSLLATGKYRSLGNIGELWQERTGEKALLLALVATDPFLKEHPDAARAFIAAYRDSIDYLRAHPDSWTSVAATVKVEDPKAVQTLRQRLEGAFLTDWTPQLIEQQKAYEKEVVATFGPGLVPEQFPEDAIATDYAR